MKPIPLPEVVFLIALRPRVLVLAAADGLTGAAVDVGQPVHPTPHQDRVEGRGRNPQFHDDLDWF